MRHKLKYLNCTPYRHDGSGFMQAEFDLRDTVA